MVEERNGANAVMKRFLPQGVANVTPAANRYYSKDHLGTTRSLTNASGTLLNAFEYDPYGRISLIPVPANAASLGPVATAAVSSLAHGGAGSFDIALPLSGSPGIEMRNAGGNYAVTVTFSTPVSAATAVVASGVGIAGTPSFSGNTATVQLTGVADRQTLTLELDNVTGTGGVTPKVLVAMSLLVGDINQNSAVTVEDIELAKKYAGYAVDNSTFTYDVTKNGSINVSDINLTKTMQGQGASLYPDAAYTGHYYHARSGLYLATYRAYNPMTGRWISRDSMGELGPDGPNLYTYVRNDPTTYVDPHGQFAWIPVILAVLAGKVIVDTVEGVSTAAISAKSLADQAQAYRDTVDRINCYYGGDVPPQIRQDLYKWRSEIINNMGADVATIVEGVPGTTFTGSASDPRGTLHPRPR